MRMASVNLIRATTVNVMTFAKRREQLLSRLSRPLLLAAGQPLARNYPANTFPFRADSNFLYFFEAPEAGSMALFEPRSKQVTLFLPRRTVEDSLWHGELESFAQARARHHVDEVLEVDGLEDELRRRSLLGNLDALAVADNVTTNTLSRLTNQTLNFAQPDAVGALSVREQIASLRLLKTTDEIAVMRRTALATKAAHVAAMRMTTEGLTEQDLCAQVEFQFAKHGCTSAYQTILSVRGEVLHNHGHNNVLRNGDIVLLDGGAEDLSTGYCSDVTRCWPVAKRFEPLAAEVYALVLLAQQKAIDAVRPGIRFRELHLLCSRALADGLAQLGLLKGSADSLVEQGAHAMFFPHGLGHHIGLDVHDLESFGDAIHYPNGATRSAQFGLSFLRMDMALKENMTFTIEPGLYFVPAIVKSPSFRNTFAQAVSFEKAETFLSMNNGHGFGGIRIEDDILCTSAGAEVLTEAIPKSIRDIEAERAG
jgi:Xaa-Pro aminopeptidase